MRSVGKRRFNRRSWHGADVPLAEMDTTAFYAASSGLCFTLLGFWWVVVQFRHAELTADRETRRFIFLVSLHFIVPGVVSLASLLATGPMWRVAFGLAVITGVIAAIAGTRAGAAHPVLADVRRWAWLGIPIYALVTVIALVPDAVRTSLGLEPLQVEGLLLLAILVLGILLVWTVFTGSHIRTRERAVKGNPEMIGR
jgi:hypothetical protein